MSPARWFAVAPAVVVVLIALIGPDIPAASATAAAAGPFQPADPARPLGTDVLGRDVLARVLAGGRTLVLQAGAATLIGSAVGLAVGVWAGTTSRTSLAGVVMRLVDAVAAIPAIIVLLLLAAGFPGNDLVVMGVIAAVSIPFSVRVLRERAAALAATDYARDAAARGESRWRRVRDDILPGLTPTALTEAGVRFVAATQLAATAGFLGLGAGAPAANWGRLVRENSTGMMSNPAPVIVPAVLLVVLAVGVTVALDRAAETRVGGLGPAGAAP
ncbi:ABC transporter permease [Microbacterium sp.]|uniref:ABC transporter permease n=1 Tax=Microbacterium sp. TaxID=51671 RepID=UPI003A876BBE